MGMRKIVREIADPIFTTKDGPFLKPKVTMSDLVHKINFLNWRITSEFHVHHTLAPDIRMCCDGRFNF